MRLLRIKLTTCAAIFAGILLLVACDEPEISVSSSHLTFQADETENQTVSISTNASKWEVMQGTPAWIQLSENQNNDQLLVSVQDYTNTSDAREGTITLSASIRKKTATADILVIQQKKPINTLSVTSSLSFEANETGEKSINVTTDAPNWEAAKNANDTWLTITKQGQTLIVNVTSRNTQSTSRVAEITFTAGNAPSVKCVVTQGGKDILGINAASLTFKSADNNGQTVAVTTSSSTWDATTSGSWLTLTKNNNNLTVTASRNTTSSRRNANITFTAGSADNVVLPVTQECDSLLISAPSLGFEYDETTAKNVLVTTNAPSWNATTTDSWVRINMSGNLLSVNPTSTNTSTTDRSANVTVTAGYAQSVTLQITQAAPPPPPDEPTLTVTPNSYSFGWNSQSNQYFTVTTNQSSWSATKVNSASWLDITPSGNQLRVSPNSNNPSTTAARTETIRFTAGNATPVTRTVTQSPMPQPIDGPYNFTATGTPVENSSYGYNYTSWTGTARPNNSVSPPNCSFSNWGRSTIPVYIDYVNGSYRLNTTTRVLTDSDGDEGYFCMCTIDANGYATPRPGVNYNVSYNPTTKIIDFSGTYNGYPTCIAIIPKNPRTGQWLTDYYYINTYRNLKIQLTTATSAPQLSDDENIINLLNNSTDSQGNIIEIKKIPFKK